MKRLFVVLALLVVGAVAIGFYRGWFTVSNSAPVAGSHDVNVNLATDSDKLKEDIQTVKDKAGQLTDPPKPDAIDADEQPAGTEETDTPAPQAGRRTEPEAAKAATIGRE